MPEAYCGPAPEPQVLLAAWNADVVALGLCGALFCLYYFYGQRSGRVPLALAIATLLVLFISPFCALTVALFSARAAHHVLLIAVAAPLLALVFPEQDSDARKLPLSFIVGLHAVILWFWHAPQAYEAGIYSAFGYWAMQGTLLGSGFLLWRRVLASGMAMGPSLLALLATVIQMGMLGALLTFAREPLYPPHFMTTLPYGLTPLADQQLAGLIMWVPAALPYLIAALLLLAARLGDPVRTARR